MNTETFGLAPWEACEEKMNSVFFHSLQGLPETGTLRGGEGAENSLTHRAQTALAEDQASQGLGGRC